MKIKCVKPYRNKELVYKPGDVVEVTLQEKYFLLTDAPGCFEEVAEKKQVKAPAKDKAVKSAKAK